MFQRISHVLAAYLLTCCAGNRDHNHHHQFRYLHTGLRYHFPTTGICPGPPKKISLSGGMSHV
jgi:hypothetical protein